ncbi:MAG: pilin [Candidatus Zixiibacteriota bacterium]
MPREATHVSISGPVTKSIGISVRDDNTFDASIGRLPSTGSYTITVIRVSGTDVFDVGCPSLPFYVHQAGVTPSPGFPGYYDPCADDTTGKCEACLGELIDPDKGIRENSATKAWTALGCVPTDPQEFVAWFLSSAIKLSGGIAFLLMLWGGFQMMTSTGDPEKLNQGKSIITSAAIGLLFIIFSVLLLKIIGIDIFQLPEWGQPFG